MKNIVVHSVVRKNMVTCHDCGQNFVCRLESQKYRIINGHKRCCKPHLKRRRALNPILETSNPAVSHEAAVAAAAADDFFYDVQHWDSMDDDVMAAVQNEMDLEYNAKYHGVGPDMEVNVGYFLFQSSIISLYDANSTEQPLRTGWLRDDNNEVVASSWEDYALINRFCVK
jgi:hypothetical protein